MMELIFVLVSFLSSMAGAICGIGGGVIMKPVLDALDVMDVSSVSFLSGCTVLSMSLVSVGRFIRDKEKIQKSVIIPLAAGAALGGQAGKSVFQIVKNAVDNENLVGFIQSLILLLVTLITFFYVLNKRKIRTFHLKGFFPGFGAGMALGILSAFLGIGGGPINLMALSLLFSMDSKESAISSLIIILFSQIFSLIQTVSTGNVPEVSMKYLLIMVCCGIAGAMAGREVNKSLDNRQVDRLFMGAMVLIIAINIYNTVSFGGFL